MQKKLSWQAFSGGDRTEAIEEVKLVISSNDGYIANFNMFSDLAISLSIGIEGNKIQYLHKALSSFLNISEFVTDDNSIDSKKEWLIFLNISFGRGKGDLKQEIPDVPG